MRKAQRLRRPARRCASAAISSRPSIHGIAGFGSGPAGVSTRRTVDRFCSGEKHLPSVLMRSSSHGSRRKPIRQGVMHPLGNRLGPARSQLSVGASGALAVASPVNKGSYKTLSRVWVVTLAGAAGIGDHVVPLTRLARLAGAGQAGDEGAREHRRRRGGDLAVLAGLCGDVHRLHAPAGTRRTDLRGTQAELPAGGASGIGIGADACGAGSARRHRRHRSGPQRCADGHQNRGADPNPGHDRAPFGDCHKDIVGPRWRRSLTWHKGCRGHARAPAPRSRAVAVAQRSSTRSTAHAPSDRIRSRAWRSSTHRSRRTCLRHCADSASRCPNRPHKRPGLARVGASATRPLPTSS